MNILLISTSFFKDGEYYKDELFVDNLNGKFSLAEERRGYGVGAMVVSEEAREISRENAMCIFKSIHKSQNIKVKTNKYGTLVIEVGFYED